MPKAAPTVIGSSAAINAGTASCTPGSPGTVVVGDIILILTESSDSTTAAGTPNIPAGYTRLFEETQGGGATGVTTLSVFATVAQGGDAMPTVDGVANHIGGRASIIRGAEPDVSQILVSTGNGANSGNVTLNAITITDDNCLLLGCMCTTNDANANNFTSPLTGWVNSELYDSSVNTGAGGGPALYIGNTPALGSTGTATVTNTPNIQWRSVSLAFRPLIARYGVPNFAATAVYSRLHDRYKRLRSGIWLPDCPRIWLPDGSLAA